MTWPQGCRAHLKFDTGFRRGIEPEPVSGAAGACGETCLARPFTTMLCIGAAAAGDISFRSRGAGGCGESNRWLLVLGFLVWPNARSSTELKALEIMSAGSALPPRLLGLRTLMLVPRLKPGVEFLL